MKVATVGPGWHCAQIEHSIINHWYKHTSCTVKSVGPGDSLPFLLRIKVLYSAIFFIEP